MRPNEKDGDDNLLSRFAYHSSVSALAFFQASGIPVYRLTTHPQMANGICNIATSEFDAGRAIESYIREKHPTITACPEDKLLPVFVHVPGSRIFTDSAPRIK
ncbi:hypothetical protein V8C37DRAFT_404273 [Trichoderma ceciliae]